MQETSSTVIPSTQTNFSQLSDDTPFAKNRTSITNDEFPTVSNNLDLNEFKSSSLWAKKLIGNMVPRQKNFTFSPLNLNTFSDQVKSLNKMLSRNWQVSQSVEHDIEPESTSSSQGLTSFQSGYPICFESKSIYHITNLSVNMKKAYDNSPRLGSLERAHMEWMADNEISANRMTYLRSRKMDMYRNYIFKGANPELRHAIINAFLVQKDLYPKKETTFLSSALNQRLQYVADTCEGWYKIGQNFALSVLNRKNEDDIGSLFSDLEGKKITIDWDKAFHHALRSHSIALMLGIPPHVLFLTGFAAIDIKQIILSDNLKNVEKMIIVAQIVLKTIIKIVVAMGTQLFTSGLLGLGGIDVIDIPFGVHGTRYLESQITERVFKVIDTHFDSMNGNTVKAEKIIDC